MNRKVVGIVAAVLVIAASGMVALGIRKGQEVRVQAPAGGAQVATSSAASRADILAADFPAVGFDARGKEVDAWAVRRDITSIDKRPYRSGNGDFIVYHTLAKTEVARVPFAVFRAALIRDFGDSGDSTVDPVYGDVEGEFITTNPQRLYVFLARTSIAGLTRSDIPAYLYSANLDGSEVHLVYTSPGDLFDLLLVAPDQQSAAIVRFTKAFVDPNHHEVTDLRSPELTILALPSGKVMASLPLPGDAEKYAAEHGLTDLDSSVGPLDNKVGAWLINADGSVEFTRYYAPLEPDWSAGDKELWRFDPLSKKLELLQTVPWGKYTIRSL